jgi:hypothetical protein
MFLMGKTLVLNGGKPQTLNTITTSLCLSTNKYTLLYSVQNADRTFWEVMNKDNKSPSLL